MPSVVKITITIINIIFAALGSLYPEGYKLK